MRIVRRRLPLLIALLSLAGLARATAGGEPSSRTTDMSGCRQPVGNCPIRTLQSVVLTKDHPIEGKLALRPFDRADAKAVVISSDEAIALAWDEDAQPSATSREAVLGNADPAVSWGSEHPVVYAVRWFDACVPLIGNSPDEFPTPQPTCLVAEWDTILDAYTGEFVVGGS
jgi:hypothetical protein